MIRIKKAKPDNDVEAILHALAEYKLRHRRAKIDVQRRNSVCIYIRIIDPDFNDMDLVDRDTRIWKSLQALSDDVVSQIALLLLLAPKEAKTSFANMEFEHPVESRA